MTMLKLNFSKRDAAKFRLDPETQESQLPLLIEILRQPIRPNIREERKRIRAAYALHSIGKNALPAKDVILEMLKNPEDPLSLLAVDIVSTFGPTADVVPSLIIQLKSESYGVRERAADLLGKAGPLAKSAVPALATTFETEMFRTVRWSIANALGHIGGSQAITVLHKALRDDYKSVRLIAREALDAMVPRRG